LFLSFTISPEATSYCCFSKFFVHGSTDLVWDQQVNTCLPPRYSWLLQVVFATKVTWGRGTHDFEKGKRYGATEENRVSLKGMNRP
jgi:hypothetical protein